MLAFISEQDMQRIARWFVAMIEKTGEAPAGVERYFQEADAGDLFSA